MAMIHLGDAISPPIAANNQTPVNLGPTSLMYTLIEGPIIKPLVAALKPNYPNLADTVSMLWFPVLLLGGAVAAYSILSGGKSRGSK